MSIAVEDLNAHRDTTSYILTPKRQTRDDQGLLGRLGRLGLLSMLFSLVVLDDFQRWEVQKVEERLSALGNCIACNDYARTLRPLVCLGSLRCLGNQT